MRGMDEVLAEAPDEVDGAAPSPGFGMTGCLAPAARSTRPAVITTGRLERRLWERLRVEPRVAALMSAGTADGAARAVDEALRGGADALVSFGVAAALAPVVTPGQVILGHSVVLPDGRTLSAEASWRRRLAERLGARGLAPLEARIAGADGLDGSSVDRFRCFQATFAAVADTESHVVAEMASRRGVPFVVLRVAADSLREPGLGGRSLQVGPGGRWRRGIVASLARPWLVAEALHVSRTLDRALDVLGLTVPVVLTSLAGPE